jgi:glycosyltransferase involved in cell wall biosynthesis/GT2 family glycosyltransferase
MNATIVIPTYERATTLLQTLNRLAKVDYPKGKWEAFVVDDGSKPETLVMITDWIRTSDAPVRLLQQAHRGPAVARNYGAREAAGGVLIFLDNDCLAPLDFIHRHLQVLNDHAGCWVVGRVVHPPGLRATPFGRYRDDCLEAFHRSQAESGPSETDGMTAQNLALWRSDFVRLGGFDEEFAIASSEDWELGQRAREVGIRILYDSKNAVIHNDWAVSLDHFCERQWLYSISDVLLWRKYGEQSPRARLVRENAPVRWTSDPLRLILKKMGKRLLATYPGRAAVRLACAVAERVAPDSWWNRRAYQLAVGIAIFRGVREGLVRYGEAPVASRPAMAGGNGESVARSPMSHPVCHLIDANLDTAYFRVIARHHDKVRFPVMIGSLAPEGPLQRAMTALGTPTFALGVTSRRQYGWAIARLARLLRRERVSVLHAHCFDPTFVGLIAARLAGTTFVFTRHHSDHNLRLGKHWHTRIDAWCGRHADRVIAVSEATKRIITDVERIPERKVVMVYNGAEPLPTPPPDSVKALRHRLGLDDEAVCLMMARLHEEKGHRVLFDALPRVLPQVGPLVVLLAGDGPHREQLESEVRLRGLDSVVRFLGRRDDIPELISLSSVVVLPSLAESFGLAALEAMSLGRPVVAARTGGIPEVVVDGRTGLLVPPGDADGLAVALSRILKDREWAAALGEEACRRATFFSVERMMRGYEAVYDGVDAT